MTDQTPAPRAVLRRAVVVLLIVGAALLIAVVVLLAVLLSRGAAPSADGAPTPPPAPTPLLTPTVAPSTTPDPGPPSPSSTPAEPAPPAPAPAPAPPGFTAFGAVDQVSCSRGGPAVSPTVPLVRVSWQTRRAVEVWIVRGSDDAAASRFMQVPLSGDETGFPYPLDYPCNTDAATYTLTLVGDDGQHIHQRWTVRNTGDIF